jgi:hypothetical protein
MNDSSTLDRIYDGAVALPSGRVVPFDRLVGVAELAALFTSRMDEMTNIPEKPFEITRSQVSTWASRYRTSEFPLPLPIRLARGLIWDRDDFVSPATGELLWVGPPGRWGESNRHAEG